MNISFFYTDNYFILILRKRPLNYLVEAINSYLESVYKVIKLKACPVRVNKVFAIDFQYVNFKNFIDLALYELTLFI